MSSTQIVARQHQDQLLLDAIGDQRHLVLTHHGSEGWRTFNSKFVSGSLSSRAFLAKIPVPDHADDLVLPKPGEKLGCTFRVDHRKCMFPTVLESARPEQDRFLVTLRWPDQIQQLQRRAYDRVRLPDGMVVAVRIWRDSGAACDGSPDARAVRHGQLEDISAGGMRVKLADPEGLEIERTYRCAFTPRPGKPPLMLEAILRHRETADHGRASLGFQFVGLEMIPDGQRLLDRLTRLVNRLKFSPGRRRR